MSKKNGNESSFEQQTYEFARRTANQLSRKEFLKLAASVGGGVLLNSLLASCRGPETPTTAGVTSSPTKEIGKPTQGGVIKIGRVSDADTLDAQKTSLLAAHEIMTQIYDPLIYLDAAGKVYPALAESWEFSDDNKTLTFHLREGVEFHDGSRLTAETVKWTAERHMAAETASPTAWMLGPLDSVEVIDELTVAYKYTEPFVPLWVGLSYSYCAPMSKSAVEEAGENYGRNPVGTGPFKFVSWEPDEGITLEAYEKHTWSSPYFNNTGKPYLAGAQYMIMPEEATRMAALESKDIDVIAGSDAVPVDKMGRLSETSGVELATAPQAGLVYTYLNTTYEPLGKKKVRQAINYAVNKRKMIELVLDGQAEPARSPVGSAFKSMYNPDVKKYDYDLDKAKSLMAEAGEEEGFETDFLLLEGAVFKRIGEVVKEDLSKINITVNLQSLPVAELFSKAPEKDAGMYFFWYTYSDADIVYQMLHSGESICWSFHENPELDELIKKQRVTFDKERRKEIFAEIQEIAVEQAYWLLFYEGKYVTATRDYVHGVKFDLLGFNHLQDMWMEGA